MDRCPYAAVTPQPHSRSSIPTWTEIVAAIIPFCLVLPRKKLRSVKRIAEGPGAADKGNIFNGLRLCHQALTLFLLYIMLPIMLVKRYIAAFCMGKTREAEIGAESSGARKQVSVRGEIA
jgi:hypothetical protein